MVHRSHQIPRSCDFLDLVHPYDGVGSGSGSDVGPGPFLVWLIDDRDTVIIRSAASLAAAVEVARAYRDAWGGRVRYIEHPDGGVVAPDEWEPLLATPDPLPYVYTVELRTPRSAGCDELVSALWTSTDLDEAVRWRAMLPAALRARTLIVSNAPDGHYPRAASVPGQADVRS